jgi:hypothetical protein
VGWGGSGFCRSAVVFAVAVRVICFKYHGKGLGATQVGGLEPGEACILWLRRDETAPVSAFSGASALESVKKIRLGGLPMKPEVKPRMKPSQRGSNYLDLGMNKSGFVHTLSSGRFNFYLTVLFQF